MKNHISLNKPLFYAVWLCLCFALSFTVTASAQDVKVSINVSQQPLETVLTLLEQQSGYRFFYNNDQVSGKTPVTINVKDEPLSAVLKKILPERNLTYSIVRQQIILSNVNRAVSAGKIIVRGRVTDTEGEPLVGVAVTSGKTGATTDIDGYYSIEVTAGATLTYSYLGWKTVNKKVQSDTSGLDVVMTVDSERLDDVVVIGYGTMDKKELTSAISHIGEKEFLTVSSSDPAALIKGKVPGVSIVNTGAADPNVTSSIQIRGVNSRQAGLSPLIVIDGVAGGSLQNVNPNDIASFDVLKDGAASAIYGTRGANGVILVTTKKGSKDGQLHTNYSVTVSFDKMIKELDMMNAADFRKVRLAWGGTQTDLGGNYDWLDGVSRMGFSHKHTVSLAGGKANTNYRVSVDYRNANGIDLRSNREEYGGRASITHTTKGGLFTFSANIAPRVVSSDNSDWSVFRLAIEANPTTPLMDPNAPSMYYNFMGQSAGQNPVELQKLVKSHTDMRMLDWDATAKLNLLPLLFKDPSIPVSLNTQLTFADRQYTYDKSGFTPSNTTISVNSGHAGSASRASEVEKMYQLEWLTNFSGQFGRNNVKAMLGYSYAYWQNSGFSATNSDFANDGTTSDNLGSGDYAAEEGIIGMDSYRNDSKLISFFGRVSYDWDGKYFATASLRHEGSSKFGAKHKWGNFPAFSAGWRISQESFMDGVRSWLNELKIRADYGVTGNQDFSSYQSIPTMKGFGHYLIDGKFVKIWATENNVNPDLHWEKSKNWNIGIDFSFLDNRIGGSLNYYNRRTEDLLGTYKVAVPPFVHERATVNVGTMSNQGFEFELDFTPVKTKDFSYDFNVIGSTNKNKFISFSNSDYIGEDYYDEAGVEGPFLGYYLQRIEVGQPVGNFHMWRYAGINDAGEWMVYDREGDVVPIALATEEDRTIVGNGLPKFNLSTTHTFRYRNFDLSLFFRGAFGFNIFNIHDYYYGTRKFSGNVLRKAFSKNFAISPTSSHAVTDYFLERGDYFKLDQLTLGYTFKTDKCRFFEGVRVYGTVNNVFTLTKFSGVDPSTYNVNGLTPGASGTRTYYPSTRQFILGVQVDF